jgi:hypothetical protein
MFPPRNDADLQSEDGSTWRPSSAQKGWHWHHFCILPEQEYDGLLRARRPAGWHARVAAEGAAQGGKLCGLGVDYDKGSQDTHRYMGHGLWLA